MKIKLVSATTLSMCDSVPIIESFTKLIDRPDSFDIYYDNKEGLSGIYNNELRRAKADGFDIVMFCHDDLHILDGFWRDKLIKAFRTNEYAVAGIAGSASYKKLERTNQNYPLAWSNTAFDDWAGAVMHQVSTKFDGFKTYVSAFGKTPTKVTAIDGLFIAVNLHAIGDVTFDEQFTFDFYDLDFCTSVMEANKNIIVTNIMTLHESRGEGVSDPRYFEMEQKYITKWSK